jgi:hypothetical protein
VKQLVLVYISYKKAIMLVLQKIIAQSPGGTAFMWGVELYFILAMYIQTKL